VRALCDTALGTYDAEQTNRVSSNRRHGVPAKCANPHCRSMRNELQCGDKLVPSPRSIILGVWLGNTLHWRVSCLSSWRNGGSSHPCSLPRIWGRLHGSLQDCLRKDVALVSHCALCWGGERKDGEAGCL